VSFTRQLLHNEPLRCSVHAFCSSTLGRSVGILLSHSSKKKVSSLIAYRDARTLVRSTLPAVSVSMRSNVSVVITSWGSQLRTHATMAAGRLVNARADTQFRRSPSCCPQGNISVVMIVSAA